MVKNTTVITASTGCLVEVRRIPAYFLMMVADECPIPEPPMEEVVTAGGIVERHPARPGTPEYEKYMAESAKVLAQRERMRFTRSIDAAVIRWKWPEGEWESQPPDDWSLPEAFGSISTGNRRVDYILFEVLLSASDLGSVADAMSPDVQEREVQAAKDLF